MFVPTQPKKFPSGFGIVLIWLPFALTCNSNRLGWPTSGPIQWDTLLRFFLQFSWFSSFFTIVSCLMWSHVVHHEKGGYNSRSFLFVFFVQHRSFFFNNTNVSFFFLVMIQMFLKQTKQQYKCMLYMRGLFSVKVARLNWDTPAQVVSVEEKFNEGSFQLVFIGPSGKIKLKT